MTLEAHEEQRGDAYKRLLRQEELILDVTERLVGTLKEQCITRTELARRLGRTPGFVSQVLGGGRNLTLRTIADIAAALSLEPSFQLVVSERISARPEPWVAMGGQEDTHEVGHWIHRIPRVAETPEPVHAYAEPVTRSGRHSLAPAA